MGLRRIVVASRDADIQKLARQAGQEIFVADDLLEALDIIQNVEPDLVIFDHQFTPEHIRQFFDSSNQASNIHVIIVGKDENDSATAAKFIQIGVHDYIHGKKDHHRLKQIVNQINNTGENCETTDNRFFAEDFAAQIPIVGKSQATKNILKMIKIVAKSKCSPVLIVGETGTGKELTAKAVHLLRSPKEKFVALNCAALTANLLESELFGHVKGSFTGADREKTGLLELAGNGTLFLDEISEMPLDLQPKLLRVLQEKNFRKVGGIKNITCNATIIASSNRILKHEVDAKRFRQDLYYRLNIFPIKLTPLKSPARADDIPLLTEYFIKNSTICPEKAGKIKSITNMALEKLQKHLWPGNARELLNTIERAIILETTDKIGLSSIIIDTEEIENHNQNSISNNVNDFSLAKAEKELIARALQQTGWQKTRAANLLGINRATLYAKVKQYNIEKDPFKPTQPLEVQFDQPATVAK